MIHDYEYEHTIPYEYVIYRKLDKVDFSDEIRIELDNYYREIRKLPESKCQIDGKTNINLLAEDLGRKYELIRTKYIIPFTGKEGYSSQELDFLFVCCYELYLKIHFCMLDVPVQ